ncbi:PEP/pyruvate-binding domain-containing protein [Noviherbaspirillum galbum]|uniref:Pyruvate, water dikinase n=1 Tax=Noviherbaspirillum galbum TaxID=2709383 RepID=A0A6B3ST18_9BURK|nr:PEP/pyruvate-binding domain-containing protein [Noviherbaspirillum galbum]NEX63913.1 hypothetical protein [Noviherbaspirillum galbum]
MNGLLEWKDAALQREEAGGKGWQLGLLARYGVPVPDGFVVPASACRQVMEETGLMAEIEAAEHGGDASASAAIAAACHAALLACSIPPGLTADLAAAMDARDWAAQPLAVRSSGTSEDSEKASFAGIHLSRLNVRGMPDLLQAIREVWASLWTPQAVAYRERLGISHAQASMAVVIMRLLPAQAAGIAFSCDPRTGRDDRIVIHAHWGLAESLVSGEAAGDEYLLQEDVHGGALMLAEWRVGSKLRQTGLREDGGTALRDTDPAAARRRVLDDGQALALGQLVRSTAFALDMGRPCHDIEWVWDGERFWLVQARPVTAMATNTYAEIASQPVIWTNGNTRDVVPFPLSALDWWSVRRMVNVILEQGLRMAAYPVLPGAQRTALHQGRLYLNLSLVMWEGYDAFGVSPGRINELAGGHQPEIAVPPQRWKDRLRRLPRIARYLAGSIGVRRRAHAIAARAERLAAQWRAMPLPRDALACHQALLERIAQVQGQRELAFLQGSGGASLAILVDRLERWLPGQAYRLASALLAGGEPSVTAQQGYAMMDLARAAAADPPLRRWITGAERDDQAWQRLPPSHPFRQGFEDFLRRYGHRGIYESYWRQPRWHEDPGYVLDSIAGLLDVSREAVQARQRRAVDDAWEVVRAGVPWYRRPGLKALVRQANAESSQRELARSSFMRLSDACRPLLLHIGGLLATRQALAAPPEVFELTAEEIGMALTGRLPPAGAAARVRDRLAQRAHWERQPGPDVVMEGGQAAVSGKPEVRGMAGDVRLGVATGAGIARGVARIVRAPGDGARLGPGEILVAPSTDPAWTPLFLKAGGLVMETGGYLSHGAIVAREFAVPAVVNVKGVLDWIRDGDLVEVNGATGEVRRLAPGTA